MHEWALAESILVAAVEAAKKEKIKKITEITIGMGELQQIEQDVFEFAINEIVKSQDQNFEELFKMQFLRSRMEFFRYEEKT